MDIETASRFTQAPWRRALHLSGQTMQTKALTECSLPSMFVYIKEQVTDAPYHVELHHSSARLTVTLDIVGDHPRATETPCQTGEFREDTVNLMNFAPADYRMWAHSASTRYMRNISFLFDERTAIASIDDDCGPDVFAPRLLFHDAVLFHLARTFDILLGSGEEIEPLFGDTLALALLMRLVRLGRPTHDTRNPGGLPASRLRLVKDYLAARLDRSVTLQELAEISKMSPSHLCRAFRASTGSTPYQWYLRRRIQKAKEYMLSSGLSLSEIALLTGFSDQAHFTKVFRKFVGASPAVWRKDVAN